MTLENGILSGDYRAKDKTVHKYCTLLINLFLTEADNSESSLLATLVLKRIINGIIDNGNEVSHCQRNKLQISKGEG